MTTHQLTSYHLFNYFCDHLISLSRLNKIPSTLRDPHSGEFIYQISTLLKPIYTRTHYCTLTQLHKYPLLIHLKPTHGFRSRNFAKMAKFEREGWLLADP
jgi:hypothetical protein